MSSDYSVPEIFSEKMDSRITKFLDIIEDRGGVIEEENEQEIYDHIYDQKIGTEKEYEIKLPGMVYLKVKFREMFYRRIYDNHARGTKSIEEYTLEKLDHTSVKIEGKMKKGLEKEYSPIDIESFI